MNAFKPNYMRLCFIGSIILWCGSAAAMETTLTREQQLNLLMLSEQRLLLEQRRDARGTYQQEWDIAQELHEKGFMSLQDYKKKKTAFELANLRYEEASIEYDQAKLDLLDNATHIIVTEARKYKTNDGKNSHYCLCQNSTHGGLISPYEFFRHCHRESKSYSFKHS